MLARAWTRNGRRNAKTENGLFGTHRLLEHPRSSDRRATSLLAGSLVREACVAALAKTIARAYIRSMSLMDRIKKLLGEGRRLNPFRVPNGVGCIWPRDSGFGPSPQPTDARCARGEELQANGARRGACGRRGRTESADLGSRICALSMARAIQTTSGVTSDAANGIVMIGFRTFGGRSELRAASHSARSRAMTFSGQRDADRVEGPPRAEFDELDLEAAFRGCDHQVAEPFEGFVE